MIAKILVIVGGVNWGLVGAGALFINDANWNIVNLLLGSWPTVENIVYLLVGICAVVMIFGCKCAKCKAACISCSVENK
ncbi:MAG: DUF378 domain-containing protein [bacterium]|nr:DUF378 domain-containing protein [bacterium]